MESLHGLSGRLLQQLLLTLSLVLLLFFIYLLLLVPHFVAK